MEKKKQKEICEAFRKDARLIQEFLKTLQEDHEFSEEEKQALVSIDQYLSNVDTWFSGFKVGLR